MTRPGAMPTRLDLQTDLAQPTLWLT